MRRLNICRRFLPKSEEWSMVSRYFLLHRVFGYPLRIPPVYQTHRLLVDASSVNPDESIQRYCARKLWHCNFVYGLSLAGINTFSSSKNGIQNVLLGSKTWNFGPTFLTRAFSWTIGGNNGEYSDEEFEKREIEDTPVNLEEVARVSGVVEEIFASNRRFEAGLDQCDVDLSHSLVHHVLRRLSNAWRPAFSFFSWAGKQPGFLHNSLTYNTMMSIFAKNRQYMAMNELLEEMGKKRDVLNIKTFEIAIRGFCSGKQYKRSVQMFASMERYGFLADINTFNVLLASLSKAKLAREAHALFERMRERLIPNGNTYSVLIYGWCRVRNLTEAVKLWNEMVDEGFRPDILVHNIMLEGLFSCRRIDDALKLFELMKANHVIPNKKSYTIVIHGLCKAKKITEAMKLFSEMQEHGYPADGAVYAYLIKGFGARKKFNLAYQLLQEMKDKEVPCDFRIYNVLFKAMLISRRPDEASNLYDQMVQRNVVPSVPTYNMLMKLYFSTKRPEMGFSVWDQMAKNGCCPDFESYTIFIGGLIMEGRSQEACTYMESMIDKGMKLPRFNTNKFLADFSRAGRPNIYEELAEKMKMAGKLDISDAFLRFSRKMKDRVRKRNA